MTRSLAIELIRVQLAAMSAYSGMALTASAALPQIARTWRQASTAGLSTATWVLSLAAYVAWAGYGVLRPSLPQIPGNAIGAVGAALVLAGVVRRESNFIVLAGALGMLFLVGVTCTARFGPQGLGWLAVVISNSRMLPQVLAVARAPETTGVSVVSWAITALSAVCWLLYAALDNDRPVIVSGVAAFVAALVIIRSATAGPSRRSRGGRAPEAA